MDFLFRPSVQPYLISLLRQNPGQAFARLQIPALIVQGSHDIQVSVADAHALQAAKPDAELLIIPGMNHLLRISALDLPALERPAKATSRPISAGHCSTRLALLIKVACWQRDTRGVVDDMGNLLIPPNGLES